MWKKTVFDELKEHVKVQDVQNTQKEDDGDLEKKLMRQKELLRKVTIGSVLFCIAVVLGIFLFQTFSSPKYVVDEIQLAAKVDNTYITKVEVEHWYAFLKTQSASMNVGSISKAQVLQQLIEYELMVKEANSKNIIVTEPEINELFDAYNQMAMYKLEVILKQQNQTIDDFREYLRNTIMIQKLTNEIIGEQYVSENEIDDFISKNEVFIARQTYGQNLTDDEIRSSVKLTIVDIKKAEKKNAYKDNLLASADIIYYNEYDSLLASF